jgi:hypothetical protein
MVEFEYGSRSCDGDDDLAGMCNTNANSGAQAQLHEAELYLLNSTCEIE